MALDRLQHKESSIWGAADREAPRVDGDRRESRPYPLALGRRR
jgi:hypothetical protein